MLVLHTLLLLGFIVISSFVSACLIAPVVVMVLSQLTGVFAAKAVLSNLAFVGSILYIATITSFIVMKISDYLRYRKYANYNQQQLKEPREPNIFVAYIKAKHDKICPKIEFVG
jgi:ABC-type transport system involved in multi-copper enzyme maturation permease subunit